MRVWMKGVIATGQRVNLLYVVLIVRLCLFLRHLRHRGKSRPFVGKISVWDTFFHLSYGNSMIIRVLLLLIPLRSNLVLGGGSSGAGDRDSGSRDSGGIGAQRNGVMVCTGEPVFSNNLIGLLL